MTAIATTADAERLRELVQAARSPATLRAYRAHWARFQDWCRIRGQTGSPTAETVATYLAGLQRSPSTVGQARAAISSALRALGYQDTTTHEGVKLAVAGHKRTWGRPPAQAQGLTAEALQQLEDTASDTDLALVAVMRDAMLRRSETSALRWQDITPQRDGSGRVFVAKSKTDQDAAGAVLWLSPATMRALARLRGLVTGPRDRVFGIGAAQIGRRIAAAASRAGLPGHFSGHSPRIGMAQDLAAAGAGLPAIMQAGRWQSARMVSTYVREQEAARGAVAKWYAR